MNTEKTFSTWQTIIYSAILTSIGIVIVFLLAEGIARIIEEEDVSQDQLSSEMHDELGWIPKPGSAGVHRTREFVAEYSINELGMNDEPIENSSGIENRILAIGDSHTYAVGASTDEAWPNALEKVLYGTNGHRSGVVFNGGVAGYGLGQYLLRIRELSPTLELDLVIVAFSMATDLYDLIPPERGGFIYGGDVGRVYFDLTSDGELVEVRNLVGMTNIRESSKGENSTNVGTEKRAFSVRMRGLMGNFALYRRFKRSGIAMWIATHWQFGNQSLWPGLDTALKIELSEDDRYRWTLAEKLIHKMAEEAKSKGMEMVLVNIPYLAQVYDDVWNASFGSAPDRYDRWIAGERLRAICERSGIPYIDTTGPMIEETRKTGKWLHHRKDAHPTAEGHRIIARSIASELQKHDRVMFSDR